ncbi:hypothetical protein RIF29_01922 [Crotalaria pallida]|uniref:Uncharacterized protein n=1 Tax=Crotalaria pallida TaxID=3830 RepID=A0AAN9IXU7_CROPI
MGSSFSEEDGECRFFDAVEDVVSIGDAKSDGNDGSGSGPREGLNNGFDYDLWIQSPGSVRERKSRFMKRMGLSVDCIERGEEIDRVSNVNGVVDRSCDFEEEFCSSRSSMSCWSTLNYSEEFGLVENSAYQDGNLEGVVGSNLDQEGQNRKLSDGVRDVDSDRSVVAEEHEDHENTIREFEEMEFKEDKLHHINSIIALEV